MIVPMKWLQTFTNVKATPQEFARVMTMTGSKVEGFVSESENIKNVVAGKIVSLKRHPDSDHLWVCSVFIGKGIIQIVTGAQNLRDSDIVPVAMPGSVLPNGQRIEAGELRGVKSEGMLCSLAELGLTKNDFPECVEDGIMVLPEKTHIGADITKVLGLDDTIFEFEITSNRPDCLCVTGLAREAAISFGAEFKLPRPKVTKSHGHISSMVSVSNETPKNCLRYTGAIVENVRIKPSPQWMRERLRRCGVRPINNIVDITNYVMLECNQPMHAFDYRQVKDRQIVVRQAKHNEEIVTLDGIKRTLSPDIMVIADSEKPIAVAGVMGGEYSGIAGDTTSIVLESACFSAKSVRAASKALGLRSEASSRFEKGLDPYNTEPAIIRALELIEQLDAGDIVKGIVDAKGNMSPPAPVSLNPIELNAFLGTAIPVEFMVNTLQCLGCTVDNKLNVTPPSFRGDIECMADLAEEIARFSGYENIPSTIMTGVAVGRLTARQRFNEDLLDICIASGLYEINTYTFMGAKDLDALGISPYDPLRNAVMLQNPLGEDTAMLRTTALPGMIEVLAHNFKARITRAKLFEFATEFIPNADAALPTEREKLIVGMYGSSDFYDIKGVVELLAKRARIGSYRVEPVTDNPVYHPGRAAAAYAGDQCFAVFGELMPTVVDAYGMHERVYIADIDVDMLFTLRNTDYKYRPLPKFPAVTRDLALVCDIDVPAAAIEHAIREGCGEMLEDVRVFDVYTGDKVDLGKKSIAYSLVLRDTNRTLTDEDVDVAIGRALGYLRAIGIEIRS